LTNSNVRFWRQCDAAIGFAPEHRRLCRCIRLFNHNIIDLYRVPVGMPAVVV
jgi:hypothetical protein